MARAGHAHWIESGDKNITWGRNTKKQNLEPGKKNSGGSGKKTGRISQLKDKTTLVFRGKQLFLSCFLCLLPSFFPWFYNLSDSPKTQGLLTRTQSFKAIVFLI